MCVCVCSMCEGGMPHKTPHGAALEPGRLRQELGIEGKTNWLEGRGGFPAFSSGG